METKKSSQTSFANPMTNRISNQSAASQFQYTVPLKQSSDSSMYPQNSVPKQEKENSHMNFFTIQNGSNKKQPPAQFKLEFIDPNQTAHQSLEIASSSHDYNYSSCSSTVGGGADHSSSKYGVLLKLVEKNQQLALDSEQRLKEREAFYSQKMTQLSNDHQIEVSRLKAEIKLLEEFKTISKSGSVGGSNNVAEKMRKMLMDEIENIKNTSQQKEITLYTTINVLQTQISEQESALSSLQNQLIEESSKRRDLELASRKVAKDQEALQNDFQKKQEQEINKYKVQLDSMRSQVVDHASANKELTERDQSYNDLLKDHDSLREVIRNQEFLGIERIKAVYQEKLASEEYYCDRIKSLEGKCELLDKSIREKESLFEKKERMMGEQIKMLHEELKYKSEYNQTKRMEYADKVEELKRDIVEEQERGYHSDNELIAIISSTIASFQNSVENQSSHKMEECEKFILHLQSKINELQEQNEAYQRMVLEFNSSETKNLAKLKESITDQVNQLKACIGQYVQEKEVLYQAARDHTQQMDELCQSHNAKEIDSNSHIATLCMEIQDAKFNLRKLQLEDKSRDDLKMNLESKERELKLIKDKLSSVEDGYNQLEKQLKACSNKEKLDLLKAKDIQISSLKSTIDKLKLQNLEIDSYHLQKEEELVMQLREKSEKLDEVIVKYSRLLQQSRGEESKSISTWGLRQQVLMSKISKLQDDSSKLNQGFLGSQNYSKLVALLKETSIKVDKLSGIDSLKEKDQQIQSLSLTVKNQEAQLQKCKKMTSDYETHYAEATQERINQWQLMDQINSQIKCLVQEKMERDQKMEARLISVLNGCSSQQNINDSNELQQALSHISQLTSLAFENNRIHQKELTEVKTEAENSKLQIVNENQTLIQLTLNQKLKIQSLEQELEELQIENLKSREILDRQCERLVRQRQSQGLKPLSDSPLEFKLEELQKKATVVKSVADANALIRDLKSILSEALSDLKLHKDYAKYQTVQREARQAFEISQLHKQKNSLLMNIALSQNCSTEIASVLKEIQKQDELVSGMYQKEIQRLIKVIAGENKEKQNSLKEHLSALRTAEKTSFLNNTTTIERAMFMSPPKSQL